MEGEKKEVFLIRVSKVTSMTGEQIDITCNYPMDASDDDLKKCLRRMTDLIDARLTQVNEMLLKDTGKSMREYNEEAQGRFKVGEEEPKVEQP